MKIYFAGSIRGGRNDASLYSEIIDFLKKYGEVLTEHIGDKKLTESGDDGPSDRFIHDRDLEWLKAADVLVAEVTQVSLGVGYEIGRAVESGQKVIGLYRPGTGKRLSAMIAGNNDIEIIKYNNFSEIQSNLESILNRTKNKIKS